MGSATPRDSAATETAPPPAVLTTGKMAGLVLVASVIGLLAGFGAAAFIWVEHELQHFLWHTLPDAIGHETAPPWLVIGILLTGGLIVHGATKLPGHGGHSPLQGFGMDIGTREIGSALLAALASLSFGAVLGPEAPLIAVGTALAALAIRKPGSPVQQVMMLVGAMAAISAIFGNPLVTAILLLEMAMAAGPAVASTPVLLAALSGMATSYLLQVGLSGWSGLGEAELGLPGLPAYPDVAVIDIVASIPLAILVAVLAIGARLSASRLDRFAERSPLATILGGALVIALSAIAVDGLTDGGLDLVLFSGQSAMPQYLALTSVGTAVIVLIGKLVAYTASLGSGFRGGPIFPAVAVGTILACITTLLVDGTSISALAATSIAAATAGVVRLPFTSLLLGVMLTYPAGGATTVLAAVGTVVGMLTRLAAEQRIPSLVPKRS